MFRAQNLQVTLWESAIPAEVLTLSAELELVDDLLDDPTFWEPFRKHFDPRLGRRSIPIETLLRMLFLKHRYRLGFERLCVEVADSISWQMFCRIGIGGDVPSPSGLAKVVARVGAETIDQVNDALLVAADKAGLVDLAKVRADTTVVEANVAYPTDAGLLGNGVDRIAVLVSKIKQAGAASRTRFRDRTRSAGKRVRAIGANLKRRTNVAREQVAALNAEIAGIAEATVADAEAVLVNARRKLAAAATPDKALARLVADLAAVVEATAKVAGQTRLRLSGTTPDGKTRVVSLHDPDARPIVKGRLGKPVEFGYKAQVVDNADGLILDYDVQIGNPSDVGFVVPAIRRIATLFGRTPNQVTADRGYCSTAVEDELADDGVAKVAIPKRGKPSIKRKAHERQHWFRRLVKWRSGCEARISAAKNSYGMDRTRFDGIEGARAWCGWAIFAHNAVAVSRIKDPTSCPRHQRIAKTRHQRQPRPAANGPPTTSTASAR